MMLPTSLLGLLFPAVAVVFLMLYVLAIQAGVEPEIALLRAGLAGVALAALGRAAQSILMSAPPAPEPAQEAPRHLDIVLDEGTEMPPAQQNGHVATNGFASPSNGSYGNNGQGHLEGRSSGL
jgi:hypothetical protein